MAAALRTAHMTTIWSSLAISFDMNTADVECQHALNKRVQEGSGFETVSALNTLRQSMAVAESVQRTLEERRQLRHAKRSQSFTEEPAVNIPKPVFRKWCLLQQFHWQRARDYACQLAQDRFAVSVPFWLFSVSAPHDLM